MYFLFDLDSKIMRIRWVLIRIRYKRLKIGRFQIGRLFENSQPIVYSFKVRRKKVPLIFQVKARL